MLRLFARVRGARAPRAAAAFAAALALGFPFGSTVAQSPARWTGGSPSWSIPSRGLVEFDRTDVVVKLHDGNDHKTGKAHSTNGLFGPIRKPPLLFEGELDEKGERIERGPWDLRDLLAWVALDAGSADFVGRRTVTARRVHNFGDVRLRLRFLPTTADGEQRIEGSVRSETPDPSKQEKKRFVERVIAPHTKHRIDGEIAITRRFGPPGVRTFQGTLHVGLGGELDDHAVRKLRLEERWSFKRTRENRDAEFDTAVREAIAKGAAWIAKDFANGKGKHTNSKEPKHSAKSSNSGRLALALLTLLKAGYKADHEAVKAGLNELRKRNVLDTYALGCAIMALEALYSPPNERQDLIDGVIDGPRIRQPSAKDRKLLEEWAARILTNLDRRPNPKQVVRFNYTGGGRYDNSVNQYGLLGLYAAQLCGIEQSQTFWTAAIQHLLQDQEKGRGGRPLELIASSAFRSTRDWERKQALEKASRRTSTGRSSGITKRKKVAPAGWGYQKPGGGPYAVWGSMTVAGITGLAVCESALQMLGAHRSKAISQAERARQQGFAWLSEHLRYETNPSRYANNQTWLYYYLYGLERACELSGVALIDDRDWYFEGASTLLAWQQKDGSWEHEVRSVAGHKAHGWMLESVCFAVLFLRKESLPVFTGGTGKR